MQKEFIKFESSVVFEGMTSIRALIRAIDTGIHDRRILKIIFDRDKSHKLIKELGYFKAVSSKYGFELIESDSTYIDSLTLGNTHGGVVAICTERTIPHFSSIEKLPEFGFYAMIDGIEDPYNFGYALRSLYSCGCSGIILGQRNWMSAAGVVCRSSAGASELFNIYSGDPAEVVDFFKKSGYSAVCADLRTDNVLGDCSLPCPLLLIVGGEKRGISRAILDKADILVRIPYANDFKASLSAASASTIFAYEVMRQNKDKLI